MNDLKKFFLKGSIFLILIIGFAYLVERSFDFFIQQNYDFKTSYISSGKINADILFIGPSRTVHMLNSNVVTKITSLRCYNAGINASNIDEQISTLLLYLKKNKEPSWVFLEVTPQYFNKKEKLHYHVSNFIPYLEDEEISRKIEGYDEFVYNYKELPLIGYSKYNYVLLKEVIKGVYQFLTESKEINYSRGYQEKNLKWDGKFDAFRKKYKEGYQIELDANAFDKYSEIIELSKAYKFKFVFYEAPIYTPALSIFSNRNEVIAQIDSLCISNKIEYWKFDSLEMNNNKKNFYNATHTNSKGTDLFSLSLSEKIRNRIPN